MPITEGHAGAGERQLSLMLVAVLGNVHHHSLPPPEEEVSGTGTEEAGEAQPHVVGHEDEHQEVGDQELHHMEQRLDEVGHAEHADSWRHNDLLHVSDGLSSVGDGDVVPAGAGVLRAAQRPPEQVLPRIL